MPSKKTIKSAFESLMFVWGEPLDVKIAADLFNISVGAAHSYFTELREEYENEGRGIVIREIDNAFQFVSRAENAEYIEKLFSPAKKRKLTQSSLEVLAIIAYKQPVTRGEVESIRGVKSDKVIEGLMKKELVEEIGRSNGIGRPVLYGTTGVFLRHFGIKDLKSLPELEDIENSIYENDSDDGYGPQQIALDFDES